MAARKALVFIERHKAWMASFGCLLVLAIGTHSLIGPTVPAAASVHPLFDLSSPDASPFPFDRWTVPDSTQNTGRRVALPLPDCEKQRSDCEDIRVINTLDGFNLQPRISIPFDGEIDVTTVTSETVCLVSLGSTLGGTDGLGRLVGINQVVWDSATKTLHVESDELLEQHTRYALIVTNGIRDTAGAPVEAALRFRRFRPLDAVHAALGVGISESEIVVASVFTTQSVTGVLEKIRDQVKAATPEPADFVLGPKGERTVFALNEVAGIAWKQHTRTNPTGFTFVQDGMNLQLLRIIPGAVGHVAFGKYVSPDYEVHPGEFIPPVATRTGVPIVQGNNEIYFNLFLPSGSKPPGGWPVAVHGIGANGSKQRDLWLVAMLAKHGIATIIINSIGRGFGALGTLDVKLIDGRSVTFPAGGRGIDQNREGTIGAQEGQNATRPRAIISNRDAQQQTVVDYMQLVRVIEVGVDVDGDLVPDLDPSRISYFGWSLGANYGTTLLAVDPSVRTGALYGLGGPSLENSRLSPARPVGSLSQGRSIGLGASLDAQMPSLINSPGIASLDGVTMAPPHLFNENMPLRDGIPLDVGLADGTTITIQSPVINTAADANEIQEYMEKRDWVNQAGNHVVYARHVRKAPLAGVPPKSVLIQFAKGDQTIANPNATALLRAGDLADRATYYRNDLAYAEDPACVPVASELCQKNPHGFVNNIAHQNPLLVAIARGAQTQIAFFLASGGMEVTHPEPARFFEVPIVLPLPEALNFIPGPSSGSVRREPGL